MFGLGSKHKLNHDYSEYLQNRNPLSFPYRTKILYPYYRSLLSGRILEVGCGLGEFLGTLPDGSQGVEINTDLVAVCLKRGLVVQQGSAEFIPHNDQSFDNIILDNVFEHLETPEPAVREFHRVLAPGGRLLLIVPNRLGWKRDPTHKIYWDETNLPQFLAQFGFLPLLMKQFPIPFKNLSNLFWPYNVFLVLAEKTESANSNDHSGTTE